METARPYRLVKASSISPVRPLEPADTDLRFRYDRRRLLMAYGKWTTKDGREVVYNRRYRPIWERQSPNHPWVKANLGEWVDDIVAHEYYYNDGHSEHQKSGRARAAMRKLKIAWKSYDQA
jgi:hypothetical protein